MKIESKTGQLSFPESTIYAFVSDFRNFNNFIPGDSVKDWKASEDTCSFSMDLLGNVEMNIIEKTPNKLVKIESNPGVSQYNFTLWIQIKEVASNDSRVRVTMEPQLNAIMLGMVKPQLKKFLDSLIDELERFKFPS